MSVIDKGMCQRNVNFVQGFVSSLQAVTAFALKVPLTRFDLAYDTT